MYRSFYNNEQEKQINKRTKKERSKSFSIIWFNKVSFD